MKRIARADAGSYGSKCAAPAHKSSMHGGGAGGDRSGGTEMAGARRGESTASAMSKSFDAMVTQIILSI
jgi:hypothetical protein